MEDDLTDRVETLERAITGEEYDLSALSTDADALDRVSQLEERAEKIETQIEELEAVTQALRGYVGNIRAVNEDVENRAETALSKVENLENRLTEEKSDNTSVEQRDDGQAQRQSTTETTTQSASSQRPASPHHRPSGQQPPTMNSGRGPEGERTFEETASTARHSRPEDGVSRDGAERSLTDRSGTETRQSESGETVPGRRDTTATQTHPQETQPAGSAAAVHHCDNCGQQTGGPGERQSTDSLQSESNRSAPDGAPGPGATQTRQKTESTNQSAGFEDIRTDDPLVSDGPDEEGGTLDRFRNLL
jgi:hypothetical protein